MAPQMDFPDGLDIPMLTGPLALGYLWRYGLFGILIVQMYIYHVCFSDKDHRGIQIYVWMIFFFEAAFTIFTTFAAWNASSKAWGHFENLLLIDWPWYPLTPLNGTIAAMVQSFYVWRIWCLTKRRIFCFLLELFAVVQLIAAFYLGIKIGLDRGSKDSLIDQTPMVVTWLACSALCDLLITAALVRFLWKAKHHSEFQQTQHIVTKIIRYTIETAFLTTIVVLLELILWCSNKQYNFHFIPFLILGTVYSNTLMATLNSRAMMFGGEGMGVMSPAGVASSLWDAPKRTRSSERSGYRLSDNIIHVTRTTEVVTESPHEMVVVKKLCTGSHSCVNGTESSSDKGLQFED